MVLFVGLFSNIYFLKYAYVKLKSGAMHLEVFESFVDKSIPNPLVHEL